MTYGGRPVVSSPTERTMNLAVTEMSDTTFLAYIAGLGISGLILLVLAIAGFGAGAGSRVLSGLFGLGFIGYAIYLAFFFTGGTVGIFLYVFIAPILLIINVVKSRKAAREAASATQAPTA
jgi:hypothetical protein